MISKESMHRTNSHQLLIGIDDLDGLNQKKYYFKNEKLLLTTGGNTTPR